MPGRYGPHYVHKGTVMLAQVWTKAFSYSKWKIVERIVYFQHRGNSLGKAHMRLW